MPRPPHINPSLDAVKGSVYSALAHRLAQHSGPVYPLHVGDTWLEPAEACRLEQFDVVSHPGMHRYTQVQGHPPLIDGLVEWDRTRTGCATERDQILVTAGATGGLAAVVGALVQPGDEVLILAPHWPLIAGHVASFGGRPIPVPFFGEVHSSDEAVARVTEALTDRTVAIYWNTPSNPTGRVIPRPWLEALADWARERNLWILADEVYEVIQFEGEHTYSRPLAPERTFGIHSFSKGFGMAGNRCGWVVGPRATMAQVKKVSTHTFYSAPTASQLAGARVLQGAANAWVAKARAAYADVGRKVAARLGVPPAQGGTFLFLDVAASLDERGLGGFLEDCVDQGLFIAPGPSFGPYPTHVRLCFTSIAPERTLAGVEILAGLMGR